MTVGVLDLSSIVSSKTSRYNFAPLRFAKPPALRPGGLEVTAVVLDLTIRDSQAEF